MPDDAPIPYIERTRRYYQALGYGEPYHWAQFEAVPFHRLRKPLHEARITIITTAAPYQPGKGDQGPRAPYNAKAKFFQVYSAETSSNPKLCISHVTIDRDHTTAEDINSYFPLSALRRSVEAGRAGSLTRHFHGLPTNRSQRTTADVDCPELVMRCLDDGAEAAILVPNCPVCHQSCALAARALEEAGIATVIMGCAKDIVEHVGVPRFLFSDFPLGNSGGKPGDMASQDKTLAMGLDLLEAVTAPRTTVQSPLIWSSDGRWKHDFCNTDRLSDKGIAVRRAALDAAKEDAKAVRQGF